MPFNLLYITNKMKHFSFKKWACHTGCKALKTRQAYNVVVIILAKQLCAVVKSFVNNGLKCKIKI